MEKHIRASDRFRTLVFDGALKCVSVAPCFDQAIVSTDAFADRTHWRIIDHCTAVTRIYAIYENFTHEMIREHLAFLQSRLAFPELPDAVRSSYRLGVAKILEKKAGPRFGDIDLAQLIGGYDKALSGKDYTLEPRAMLMQEQNLRLLELQRLMNACGVEGSVDWIEQHRDIRNFFETNNRLAASAGSEMAELIKYRNDAAHGTLDIGDILHANVLIEFCHFVAAVCEALAGC
ncbi:MAG: HEPN domain-containing protein [Betaproteobacteria bacterium]